MSMALRRRGLTRVQKQDLRSALCFISPWLIGFTVFLAYPIVMSLYYSFCDFSVLLPPRFIGTANYQGLWSDDIFRTSLWNTMFYAAMAIPLGAVLALTLAMLLNTGVRGMTIYRTLFFLPSLVPQVAMAILWLLILNGKNGLLNVTLAWLTSHWLFSLAALLTILLLARSAVPTRAGEPLKARLPWLIAGAVGAVAVYILAATGQTALFSANPELPAWLSKKEFVKPAFVLVSLYGTGHAVVIYLAGLQDVPQHLLEAADLDGASWWQKIRHVTLPMVSPTILFNGIMAIIGTFNYFALPFVMAPGGQPARSAYFLAVNLYDTAFQYMRMGYASAMAWILFIIVLLLTSLAMRISRRFVHYGSN